MGARGILGYLKEAYKIQIATILEYRTSFFSQSLGMLINDVLWIFFWYIMFERFGSINGWKFTDTLLLYAVFAGSHAIVLLFFSNVYGLAGMIENGQLDYYLTLPKPLLLMILVNTSYSGAGDFVFAWFLAFWVLPLSTIPLYVLLLITGALILIGWSLMASSITFFVGRFETAAKGARDALFIFSGYPYSVYSGMTRFVLMFFIPVGMFIGVPVQILQNFSMEWFLLLLAFVGSFFLIAVSVFYIGLRRYSSGNVMGMRG